ncbi:MAG: prolyl oligopeptidase family serine peptidase [Bryobacteraceae bacterium]
MAPHSPNFLASRLQILLLVATTIGSLGAQTRPEPSDPYQWLEDVTGERSMAWVRAENARSAKVLQNDPRYAGMEAAALKVLESPDRLPTPLINGTDVYNTWQDAQHVSGILRRTTLADYLTPQPHWRTLVDYDALGKQDKQKWVEQGLTCLYPKNEFCLVGLSAGGEDAATLREFNLKTGAFVAAGFVLPRSKQSVEWADKDTLLVARDWGAGTMTKSGYPFVVKLWKRGQSLDKAKEVYRGVQTDVGAGIRTFNDIAGHRATILARALNFFESENALLTSAGVKRIGLPPKVDINDLLSGQLIVTLNEDWQPEPAGVKLAQGSVVSLDLATLEKDPLHPKPRVVFAPTATEFAQQVAATGKHLVVTTLENVQGRVYIYTFAAKGAWTRTKLNVPDNRTVNIVSTNWSNDQFFLSLSGFLNPSSLMLGDAAAGTYKEVKALPPQFDASADVVEQLTAVSKDGTKIPYFLVHRKDIRYDGSNPVVLNAYGGFQISETPFYSPVLGKLWLERGGVFALANIRGGGEFGPAWHDAGLKTHRQRIYDDFTAVGRDLVSRKITSPRRLGIQGGSNGGLLMGVEMTQHPEMWNAIVIQVPLLDMLRYEQIAAGASWVSEFGSVANPEERAFLASISPYHQLKKDVTYPEPLIFTTSKDDRVGPVHARKFAARMKEYNKPYFYDEIIEGGHGAGADLKEEAKTRAVTYIYLTRKLMD